jgi:hypothetical protein
VKRCDWKNWLLERSEDKPWKAEPRELEKKECRDSEEESAEFNEEAENYNTEGSN